MADGLYYLHGIRIVHGDLKCQNVLVFMSPAGPVPLICDFGMSKVLDIGGFTTQSVGRTKDFIAPELYDGSMAPNYATDIWAFGVISDVSKLLAVLFHEHCSCCSSLYVATIHRL